ncbi:hypothetical protein GF354_01675 [Candidatus Peregrinibacteria bacterium]|nr:hypothetical protein [Candidatus Peregrinibacteria bacterium]
MKMNFNYLESFLKDLKKLKKKIPSLEGDLKNFEKFIPSVDFNNNKRFVTLTNSPEKGVRVIKTRLMVRSLKGASKTRLIFSFCVKRDSIDFIEIYLKNERPRENSSRIDKYINSL